MARALRLGMARGASAAAKFVNTNTKISDMWGYVSGPSVAVRTG